MLTPKEFKQIEAVMKTMFEIEVNGINHIPDNNILTVLQAFMEKKIK